MIINVTVNEESWLHQLTSKTGTDLDSVPLKLLITLVVKPFPYSFSSPQTTIGSTSNRKRSRPSTQQTDLLTSTTPFFSSILNSHIGFLFFCFFGNQVSDSPLRSLGCVCVDVMLFHAFLARRGTYTTAFHRCMTNLRSAKASVGWLV
jgi:hypothetical protein